MLTPEEISRRKVMRLHMAQIPVPTAGDIRAIIGYDSRELADLTLIARELNNDRRRNGQ